MIEGEQSMAGEETIGMILHEARYRKAVRAMKDGDESSKTKVAFYMLSGICGAEFDPDGAVALLEERLKDGDSDAMWMLGLCCEFGMGIEQNIDRADRLYRFSCRHGNAAGEFLMSNGCDKRGSGVMKVECCL